MTSHVRALLLSLFLVVGACSAESNDAPASTVPDTSVSPPSTVEISAPPTTSPTTSPPTPTTVTQAPLPETASTTTGPPVPAAARIRTLDAGVDWPGMALGPDGSPALLHSGGEGLRLVACHDPDCETFSGTRVDSDEYPASFGDYDLAVGADGTVHIAYSTALDSELHVVSCPDGNCSSSSRTVVASTGDPGWDPLVSAAVAISSDGNPMVAFHSLDGLQWIHCLDRECTATETALLVEYDRASVAFSSRTIDIEVTTAGSPIIASSVMHPVSPRTDLVSCADATCGDFTTTRLGDDEAINVDLSVGTEDVVVVASIGSIMTDDEESSVVRLYSCDALPCDMGVSRLEVPLGDGTVDIAPRVGDTPVIAFWSWAERELSLHVCADRLCAEGVVPTGFVVPASPPDAAIGVRPDGEIVLAYGADAELKVAFCSDTACAVEEPTQDSNWAVTTILTDVVSPADANIAAGYDPQGRLVMVPTVKDDTSPIGTRPMFVRCADDECSVFTSMMLDVPSWQNTLAFGADGLPVIATHDFSSVGLILCADPDCSAYSTVTVVDAAFDGRELFTFTPVAIAYGASGDGRIPALAFEDTYNVRLVVCSTPDCTDIEADRLLGVSGNSTPMTVDLGFTRAGHPIVAVSIPNGDTRVAVCGDQYCQEEPQVVVHQGGFNGLTADLAMSSAGDVWVASHAAKRLLLTRCDSADCAGAAPMDLGSADAEAKASVGPSIAFTGAGLPVVAYWGPGRRLRVSACHDAACEEIATSVYEKTGAYTLLIAADGRLVVPHHLNGDLRIAVLPGIPR